MIYRVPAAENIFAGQLIHFDVGAMTIQRWDVKVFPKPDGIALHSIIAGEPVEFDPVGNTADILTSTNGNAMFVETSQAGSIGVIVDRGCRINQMAGEEIRSGDLVFVDSDGLVRITDRDEAARRQADGEAHRAAIRRDCQAEIDALRSGSLTADEPIITRGP